MGLTLVLCVGFGKWRVTVKWHLIKGRGICDGGWMGLAELLMSAVLLLPCQLGVLCSEPTVSGEKSLQLFSSLLE